MQEREMKSGFIFSALLTLLVTPALFAGDSYTPPPESAGGWRWCKTPEEVRSHTGMDPDKLELIKQRQLQLFAGPWQIIIIRKGYLVAEWYGVPTMPTTTFDGWSSTKSSTGIAFGLLMDDSRHHKLPHDAQIDLDTPIYDYVPEGFPLSDPGKKNIKLRHVLSMTSGIPGEDHGLIGLSSAPGGGDFEIALGKQPNRFGKSAAKLTSEPGTTWEYSDAGFAHLSLFFYHATGRELADFMKERVFYPIGIENFGWDKQGGVAGNIGPHTNPHSGLRFTGRDFARLGYLMAHDGKWGDKQIVPHWWMELATKSSQTLNPSYGYTFWVNTDGKLWPTAPRDTFAFRGFTASRLYVVPSLDLVVARLAYAPQNWDEGNLLPAVLAAITDSSADAK
jgi:CubicO group peptidase (beta-lactamase class C family)